MLLNQMKEAQYMKLRQEITNQSLQLFEPGPDAVYSLEVTVRLAHVPRRMIAVYYKHGLVSPVADPACDGFYFNNEGIRALRRIEYLRTVCGINLIGVKMILTLMNETDRLRAEARFLRAR
jgi:DNA-binding transcriptional MerR regulator